MSEGIKMWWSGDSRVSEFMQPVYDALDRSGLEGQAKIDVSNRAYEAVYNAIIKYNNPLMVKGKS